MAAAAAGAAKITRNDSPRKIRRGEQPQDLTDLMVSLVVERLVT